MFLRAFKLIMRKYLFSPPNFKSAMSYGKMLGKETRRFVWLSPGSIYVFVAGLTIDELSSLEAMAGKF
jgi:hypothetical protein